MLGHCFGHFGHLGHLIGHVGSLGQDVKEEVLAIAFGQKHQLLASQTQELTRVTDVGSFIWSFGLFSWSFWVIGS